ncbi:putative membrane protein YkoI [Pararhizobium capsulatum DSM 1112]|uniref:Membrane protein YkoI n=1 Tax=Pararhizobium capsulatum DSM 1112 TaxID=1121113 RepID=A0ABU0BKC0_9HYPH|nr:PepSY domain-containing protein [Pararhizobium capsulatum]MDQ0318452.1 putative membrane protein YkoI [Pararhizobium capsulatum DSM 1112]
MTGYKSLSVAMAVLLATGSVASVLTTPIAAIAAEHEDKKDDASEFAKLNAAKISLSEAVAAAEKANGGKAVNAALDNEQADAVFEVELMTADGSKSVSVDAMTGKVSQIADQGESGQESDVE